MASLKHVAIIMDGNGRWAQRQSKARTIGHYYGSENVRQIALASLDLGIEVLTLYAFSTENWKRPQPEVDYLMKLPAIFFEKFLDELMEKGICVRTIGDLSGIPLKTRQVMENAVAKTQHNRRLVLNFALNYGSRNEIIRAVNVLIASQVERVDEDLFSSFLDTGGLPEVDLLIRTGGEIRLSNFLLWQLAYSEFVFSDIEWPQFGSDAFAACIETYHDRKRTYGGI